MDTITALALSAENPLIHALGIFLSNAIIYAAVIGILLFIGEKRNEKRMKVIVALLLAALTVWIIKYTMACERPCVGESWCPHDYSFPSMHAVAAFTLMISFLNKRNYPLFLLFALFVSFTRLNLGVHIFRDIAGALPIALTSYYLTDLVWTKRGFESGTSAFDREDSRQLFHIIVGLSAIAVLLILGRGFLLAGIFFTILIGTILINARLSGKKIAFVQWFEERFERENAKLPGWGSACYAAGALVIVSFLTDINQIAAALLVLGLGDGISTLVGKRGIATLPYNKKKTFEGMAAMFLSSLVSWFFIGWLAVPLALVAALVESMPVLDDNLSVPFACTLFLLVVG